jgi:hypothetical protein
LLHLRDAFLAPARPDLVARKAGERGSWIASSSPVVCSARPYIGELSISVPPFLNSSSSTAGSCL